MRTLKPFTLNSKHILKIAISITLIYGISQIIWGEKIPVNDGCGWDGITYCEIAKNFELLFTTKQIDWYYLQRSAPSALVYYTLKSFNLPLFTNNIIRTFEIYNLIFLTISLVIWHFIAQELKLQIISYTFGFVLLFAHWLFLKFYFYYPVLTDMSAFTLGMALVLLFLKRQQNGILIIMVIGNFIWPSFFLFGSMLYLFPLAQQAEYWSSPNHLKAIWAIGITAIAAIMYLAPTLFVASQTWINTVSALLVLVYIFLVVTSLFKNISLLDSRQWLKKEILTRMFLLFMAYVVNQLLVKIFESGKPAVTSFQFFLFDSLIARPTQLPLIFLVTHTFSYGVSTLLIIFFFKDFCQQVNKWGLGATLFTTMTLAFALNWESRHIIHAFPFIVVALVKVMDKYRWESPEYGILVLLTFVISRIWISFATTEAEYLNRATFPALNYFMYYPYSIPVIIYFYQIIIVSICGAVIYWLLFRKKIKADY